MTERDLSALVRDHVTSGEPPFALSPDSAIGQGRRVVRRSRTIAGVACAAVVATAAFVAVPRLADNSSTSGTGIDPAIQRALDEYDASQMPRIMDEHATVVLDAAGLDLGKGEFFAGAGPNSHESLPPDRLDEAEGMGITYGRGTDQEFGLQLQHSGSDAEGDTRKDCANSLADGTYLSCEVTVSDRGEVVLTRLWALTPGHLMGPSNTRGWEVVSRGRLDNIDPRKLWFERNVKVVKSDTFLTNAEERVKAPDRATAESRMRVPEAALRDLATDPDLVIPLPK